MPGSSRFVSWKGATSITCRKSAHSRSSYSSTGAIFWKPALLTRMSTPPRSSMARSPRAAASSMLARSAWRKSPPISSAASRPLSLRSLTMTRTPEPASTRAMALPMPLAAPVTSAVLSAVNFSPSMFSVAVFR